jgi:NADPH-dependent 2,4-dienoyl-CoA reductase/sulfur reductase-like enzyme/rhodanese-related sulfurtransferase
MKVVIVGGVAGGATAAARIRRMSESAEITLIERGPYVSFANCGLPYFISGDISKRSQLLLQTPEGFDARYRVNAMLRTEAVEIDRPGKRIKVVSADGERWIEYDKLLLAQGGNPILPPLPGIDAPHVFKLWTVPDMDRIHTYIQKEQPKTAIVAGGGFIGLEMAEAFHARGINTTVVELAGQVMAHMDKEFGAMIKETLIHHGIGVETGVGIASVNAESREVSLSDGRKLPADMVLFSVGVRPELTLAKQAGLAIGTSGGVLVDEHLQTSDPDIYAAGDMTEVLQKISGRRIRVPLAGPANRQGRIAATNLMGGTMKYNGATGTSVVKVLDHTAAVTGLTEKAAKEAGIAFGTVTIHKDHHANYYPGAKLLTLKLVYEKETMKVLGGQAFGAEGVDKRIDVLATALEGHLSVHELAELDLAYAPPFSSANDPINMVAFVAENAESGYSPVVTPAELFQRYARESAMILDVRNLNEFAHGHLDDAVNIPVDELRYRLDEVPRDKDIFVHCKVGFRGHLATRTLLENGFDRVWNVTGGWLSIQWHLN